MPPFVADFYETWLRYDEAVILCEVQLKTLYNLVSKHRLSTRPRVRRFQSGRVIRYVELPPATVIALARLTGNAHKLKPPLARPG